MKKALIVLAVLLINSIAGIQQAVAQNATGGSWFGNLTKRSDVQGVQFGIRTGLNFPIFVSDEGSGRWVSYTGFHVGLIADIPLSSSWYIQPGLYFENKGTEFYDSGVYSKVGMAYFDVPVLLSYRLALSNNLQLHLNAGPFAGFGAFGTTRVRYTYNGETYSEDTFDEAFSRLDAGVNIGAGLSFGKIYFGLKYDFGLINILKDTDDYYVHSRVFGITVGLNF